MILNLKALKAISRFVSKRDDARPYLTTLQVEASATETILVGMDGPTLAAYRLKTENDLTEPVMFQIPADVVRTMLTIKREEIELTQSDEFLRSADGIYFKPLTEKYPDWRRVVPTGPVSGEVAQFDVQLLKRIDDAIKDLSKRGAKPLMYIGFNGEKQAVIRHEYDDGFFALLMPYKKPIDEPIQAPDFALGTNTPELLSSGVVDA